MACFSKMDRVAEVEVSKAQSNIDKGWEKLVPELEIRLLPGKPDAWYHLRLRQTWRMTSKLEEWVAISFLLRVILRY